MAASMLRTFLFASGNHPRRVEKAFTLGADAVILGLEDAVAIAEKVETRKTVVEALSKPRACKGYVRVNAIGTQWCLGDVMEAVRSGVDGIVLPKVESAADLRAIASRPISSARKARLSRSRAGKRASHGCGRETP